MGWYLVLKLILYMLIKLQSKFSVSVNLGLNEKRQHRKHQPTTTANTENNINKLKVVG